MKTETVPGSRYLRRIFYSAVSGILSGLASAIFLHALDGITSFRLQHPTLLYGLPLGGFAVGWIFHHYGQLIAGGNNLILEEIHHPKAGLPWTMTPLILLGTLVTHLFGGSAGREGTAVQMGASLSEQWGRWCKVEREERKILLVAGAGAGFGSAIGAPLAGIIFGMEFIHVGRLKPFAWMECTIASFAAYFTAILLKAPHAPFERFPIPEMSFAVCFWVATAGVVFGLGSRLFVYTTQLVEYVQQRIFHYAPLRPAMAGLLLLVFSLWEGSLRYNGLGIAGIQEALQTPVSFLDPIFKTLFSALTVGSGFKGGEFVPLVFIGTTLGNVLSTWIPISLPLLAGLGFAAVFAGASHTPLACSLMAMEIFGFELAPYALLACFVSNKFAADRGIYRAQRKL